METYRIRWRRFFFLLFLISACVSLLAVGLIHFDPFTKSYISEKISNHISKQLKTPISLTVEYVNPLTLTCRCAAIKADNFDWHMACDSCQVRGSWLSLFTQGNFAFECSIQSVDINISLNNASCSLINTVEEFLKVPSSKPFLVESIGIQSCAFSLEDNHYRLKMQGKTSCSIKIKDSDCYLQQVMHACTCLYENQELFSVAQGSADLLLKSDTIAQGSIYYLLNSPILAENKATLYGNLSTEQHDVSLYTLDRSWDISVTHKDNEYLLAGHLALSDCMKVFFPSVACSGDLAFNLRKKDGIEGEILCNSLAVSSYRLPPLQILMQQDAHGYNGSYTLGDDCSLCTGTIDYREQKCSISCLSNYSWKCGQQYSIEGSPSFLMKAGWDAESIYCNGECFVKTPHSAIPISCSWQSLIHDMYVTAQAQGGDFLLNVNRNSINEIVVQLLKKNECIGDATLSDKRALVQGSSALLQIVGEWFGLSITGQGDWQIQSDYSEQTIALDGQLKNAQLRLGNWYNLLEKGMFKATFSPHTKALNIDYSEAVFRTGLVTSKNGVLRYTDKGLFIAVPFLVENLLVTLNKELFAQVEGYGNIQGLLEHLLVQGFFIVDKSLLNGNIFSSDLYADSSVKPMHDEVSRVEYDVVCITKNEIPVKTSLFSMSAQSTIHLQGSSAKPCLEGRVDISNGIIHFPYDVLYLKKGSIIFNPATLDPMIELVAKNSIKNYDITLSLHGSIKNPDLILSASPYLSKEQIITLLLGGSEDGSLSIMMPHTLTELFEQLLLGSPATISKAQKYLQSLFEPLKSVRLVPKFSDQTGRGGLRGALEIEVNDRLKASIQQNFSLTEDTRVDIRYAISDDALIRAAKDERGDVGCELEMKWRW